MWIADSCFLVTQPQLVESPMDVTMGNMPYSATSCRARSSWAIRMIYARFGVPISLGLLAIAGCQPTAQSQANTEFDNAVAAHRRGQYEKAIAGYTRVINFNSNDPEAYKMRGWAHEATGRYDKAIEDLSKSIQLDATDPFTYCHRAAAWNGKGEFGKAIEDYRLAISLDADLELAYHDLAWILATCPVADFRNGHEALEYAKKACGLLNWEDPLYFEALAAAYAETGDFKKAVDWQAQTMANPGRHSDTEEDKRRLEAAMEHYKAGKPYRDRRHEGRRPISRHGRRAASPST